jgi:hypothetical protein
MVGNAMKSAVRGRVGRGAECAFDDLAVETDEAMSSGLRAA